MIDDGMAFSLDKRQVDRFAQGLLERAPKATTAAAATALNRTAKGAELFARKTIKSNMTTRNKWTRWC